jgi:hypothetical protein
MRAAAMGSAGNRLRRRGGWHSTLTVRGVIELQ